MNDAIRRPILVVGHLGMLGQELMRQLGPAAEGVDREECDPARIAQVIDTIKPSCLVNCAAYTAVDDAESHRDLVMLLNTQAVENLAIATRDRDIHFITLSTDYVFRGYGEKPYAEDPPPDAFGPQSVYGQSKYEGELRLRATGGNWCIARTQWLYGEGGPNFPDTIAKLAANRKELRVVDDQVGAPTWVHDLAEALRVLIDKRATGAYHLVNSGYASWFDVARHVVNRLGLKCTVLPCTTEEFPRAAPRPYNSRMSQEKYIELNGRAMRGWIEALDEYLDTKTTEPIAH
jgi:dTDP-4-dehydrorhamnose reductase